MKTFSVIFGLALFFGVGLYVCVFIPKGLTEFPKFGQNSAALSTLNSNAVSRSPAAIRRTYDFSMLQGSALEVATKKRLLSDAKIIAHKGSVGIELGHFVLRGVDGEKAFACQRYNKITLSFEGEGMAISGELPKMEVEGACEMSADINSISALMIPVAKIMGEPVAEGEFSFHEGQDIMVKFANVSDQWPKNWHLRAVKLFDDQSGEQVSVPAKELRDYIQKPLVVSFIQ